jgi:hypothetical protein
LVVNTIVKNNPFIMALQMTRDPVLMFMQVYIFKKTHTDTADYDLLGLGRPSALLGLGRPSALKGLGKRSTFLGLLVGLGRPSTTFLTTESA